MVQGQHLRLRIRLYGNERLGDIAIAIVELFLVDEVEVAVGVESGLVYRARALTCTDTNTNTTSTIKFCPIYSAS